MRAVVIRERELVVEEYADPEPGGGELLIRVAAAGLNGADMVQRLGFYPAPPGVPADIPGLELAGTVVAQGPGPSRFSLGDRVMSIVGGGGQAELAVVPDSTAMAVPAGLSCEEAGGFSEVFLTAHDALITQCRLEANERLLVTGAAGGVGLAGVQIGLRAGASVVASVRRPELRAAVAVFGATAVAPEEVEQHGPFDVILELVGGPGVAGGIRALKTGGRMVVIGVSAGATVEVDLFEIMRRRAVLRGSTLRARPLPEKASASAAVERDLVPGLADGSLRVLVEATFPLDAVNDAYDRFGAGGKLGKIVLTLGGDDG